MNVFISHANRDTKLAKRIADYLRASRFQVMDDTEFSPDEPWTEAVSKLLGKANAMVVLLTPQSVHSHHLDQEVKYAVEHALVNRAYENRVIPVVTASSDQLDLQEIPWILRRFQMIHAPNLESDEDGLQQISQALKAVG